MAKVLLVRHGQPRYDEVESRGYFGMGHEFGRLTKLGEEQAEARASDIRFKDAELILASPYTRALQTAAIISRITGIPLTVENDLHEWLPDTTQKFQVDDWSALFNEYWNSDGVRTSETKYPWETYEALKTRFNGVLERYKHYKKIIVVCHGLAMSTQTYFKDMIDFCDVREIEI